jgi:hypothetical protein
MVSTLSTNAFTADQRIAALEQEIFNLRNAKRTFDGVEILKPARTNKTVPTEQPKAPELMTKPAPPLSQPAPVEKPTTTTQPPIHPFANVKETSYQPPHERNFAAAPAKPAKDKEPAYHYVAPIQNPHTVVNVYNKLMQAPLVTLSPEELFAISPEVHNRLCEAIMLKRVLSKTVSTHALIEQVPDDEENSITVPNVYETYINSLAPGERPIPLNVAQELHALWSITMVVDNREEVEGIIDPGSQIIAMLEAVCHDIGLAYNPSIKLNMQSANSEVDQSLGLSRNIPCKTKFAECMALGIEEAKAALTKVKDEYAMYYNHWREPALVFAPGDRVWLDGSNITTNRPSSKLSHRRLGPFVVEACVSHGTYYLALPPHFRRLHPIFPVVKLSPALPDPIPGR